MEGTHNKYLIKLATKCNLSEEFLDLIENLFDKLIDFGYISKLQKTKLSKNLLNNIDTVIISKNDSTTIDFKTGYYDANKKELYLKDISNIPAVYLRLFYAMTTKEVSHNVYNMGYASAFQSKNSFSIEHVNFGLNRAIISNLVCRLLYTLPTTLSIVPTYRTYENNFLGYKITSDNDIYFLEGKIVRQICFVLGISEEKLYSNLFSINPTRDIAKIFDKIQNTDLLKTLDSLSRTYSHYNKLCYYSKLISDNYIEIKKTANTPEASIARARGKEIELSLKKVMVKMFPELENEEEGFVNLELEGSLSEKINDLEDSILDYIAKIQNILAKEILKTKDRFSKMGYVVKLKTYEDLLILKNPDIKKEIHDTITHNLIYANEYSCTNLIEKIKYSLALLGLSTHSSLKVFNDTKFYKIASKDNTISRCIIAIKNDNFLEIANVSNLDIETENIENNVDILKTQSIAHMLNTNVSTDNLEKVITSIREYDTLLKNLDVNNLYLAKDEKHSYILVNNISTPMVFEVNKDMKISKLNLSEEYTVLGETNSLPTVYKERRLFTFFRNLPVFQKNS